MARDIARGVGAGVVDSTQFTIEDVYQAVGEKVTARWEALGQTDSKIHWQYGAEADALIPEFPAGIVYKAIAKKAGKSSQTIRKAWYTFKAFDAATREKYDLCPYSIFQHARTQKDPIAVLQHYIDNRSSVDEVEAIYPTVEDEDFEKEFESKGFIRIFYGIWREVFGIAPELKREVDYHLKEIQKIIEKANQ